MKLLTLERESSLGTLCDQELCTQFCSKDELWEAAKEKECKSRGRKYMRGCQYQKISIKKDFVSEDWIELDWTQ
jgi:hypothetical protein